MQELIIPDKVASIGVQALYGCSSLTSLTTPFVGAAIDGTSNINIGYLFNTANEKIPTTLKAITITNGKQIAAGAFSSCTSIESVTISKSIESIKNSAFSGCTSVETVVFEADSNLKTIEDNVFKDCTVLSGVILPEGLEKIGNGAFFKTNTITVDKGISYVDNWIIGYDSSDTALKIVYGTQGVADYAFKGCTTLEEVTIPDSVKHIGSYSFAGSGGSPMKIKKIILGENSSLTSIGDYAFKYCSSLTSITFAEGSQLTSIGSYAFYYCSSLTSITIPAGVTSIGVYAFYNCSSLTSLTFEDTSNWYKTGSYENWQNKTGGEAVSASEISNASTNASNFRSSYSYYCSYWYKLEE